MKKMMKSFMISHQTTLKNVNGLQYACSAIRDGHSACVANYKQSKNSQSAHCATVIIAKRLVEFPIITPLPCILRTFTP